MWTKHNPTTASFSFIPGFRMVVWKMDSGLYAVACMHESNPKPGRTEICATKRLAMDKAEEIVTFGNWPDYLERPMIPSKAPVKNAPKRKVEQKVNTEPKKMAEPSELVSAVDALRAHFGK